MRPREMSVLSAAVILCALLVLVAAACGSGAAYVAKNGVVTTGFSSRQWGFSFRYPERCIKSVPDLAASGPRGTLFQVLVADPDGTVVDGNALDAFSVTVQEMSRSADAEDLASYRGDFELMGRQLIGRPEALRVVKPWSSDQIGGRTALVAEYAFKVGRQHVIARSYLVPEGKRLYWITAQASSVSQQRTDMGVTLDSFTFD